MRLTPLVLIVSCAKAPLPATTPQAPVPAPTQPTAAAPAPGPTKHTLKDGLATTEEVRARMKKVASSLGVKCAYCHDVADFAADTHNKQVANLMWERMVVGLRTTDGKEIFCDHCHQGKAQFLDRSNEEALKAWMKSNFVEKLATHDGSKMECDTCHQGARWKFLPREPG